MLHFLARPGMRLRDRMPLALFGQSLFGQRMREPVVRHDGQADRNGLTNRLSCGMHSADPFKSCGSKARTLCKATGT